MSGLAEMLHAASSWLTVAGLAALLLAMLAMLAAVRGRMNAEVSRKAAHVGLGLVLAALPWILDDAAQVAALVSLVIAVMVAIRLVPTLRRKYGCVVHGVRRSGHGDLYFPIAALLVFVAAQGDHVLYAVPMLTLTVADAVAALVGRRYGKTRYETTEGRKSLEGSFAFFAAAFLSSHVPLLVLTDIGRMESVLVGVGFGTLVMLLEAISWRGLDNLLIPLGGFLLLRALLGLDAGTLALLTAAVVVATILLVLPIALRGGRTTRASALGRLA